MYSAVAYLNPSLDPGLIQRRGQLQVQRGPASRIPPGGENTSMSRCGMYYHFLDPGQSHETRPYR
eukprot:1362554-Amorphochlora_amoeboformis.AAC.1